MASSSVNCLFTFHNFDCAVIEKSSSKETLADIYQKIMIKRLFFLALLNFTFAFSQEKKSKEYFIDENKNVIDSKIFKHKLNDKKYWYKTFEKDTATITKLVPKEEYGRFSDEIKILIFKELEKLSGKVIGLEETVIINFFIKPESNPNGSCIDHYTSDVQFQNYTSKKKNKIKQFFIVEESYSYDNNQVINDSNGIIEKLSFEDGLGCGNYIIIKPSGAYYRKFGEYRQDKIKDIVNAEW